MKNLIVEIKNNREIFGLIIKSKRKFFKEGVDFVTKNSDFLQLGFLNHNKNYKIQSHIHIKKKRIIKYCTEVLLIYSGKVKIIFYDINGKNIKKSKILNSGDIIILFKGGHGFKFYKKTKIIEIKQGPYVDGKDKKIINQNKI